MALALGLAGILWPLIAARIRCPKLDLRFSLLDVHSEIRDDVFHLRLPVSNAAGKAPAEDVEVFLEFICGDHVTEELVLPRFLPIRLVWAHGIGPVCDRIAGGAYRLIDFGALTFTINSTTGLERALVAFCEGENPILLELHFEILPSMGQVALPVGTYTFGFLIASKSSVCRQQVTLSVLRRGFDDGAELATFVQINRG